MVRWVSLKDKAIQGTRSFFLVETINLVTCKEKIQDSPKGCSVYIWPSLLLNISLKICKLSDPSSHAQEWSQRTPHPLAWKIKPWFHISIFFLKSVCWKILKLYTNPACCFFARTLIVSNRCSSICFTFWQVHLSFFPLHIPLVKIMNKLQGNDKCVDNQDETQMKWRGCISLQSCKLFSFLVHWHAWLRN